MIRVLRTFTLTLLLAGVAASVATADAFPGPGSYTHGTYTSNGDVYSYGVYVPSSYRSGQHVPLVVMIHGCNTPADLQAQANEYDSLAEQHDFIVLYPDFDAADLAAFHCWKAFWAPELEGRDKGDAAAIAGMTRAVMSAMTIDPARVYAIGMSSGAFETSVLGAEYPDLYAAIGIHSGAAFMHGENGCFVTYAPTFSTDSLASDAYTAEGPRARVLGVLLRPPTNPRRRRLAVRQLARRARTSRGRSTSMLGQAARTGCLLGAGVPVASAGTGCSVRWVGSVVCGAQRWRIEQAGA